MSENVTNEGENGTESSDIPVEVEAADEPVGGNGTDSEAAAEGETLTEDGIAIEVEAPESEEAGEAEAQEGETAASEADEAAEQIGQLEAQVATLEAEKKDNWDKFLRATADLENFRKRSRRDVEDARISSASNVLKEMLPVMDNLERALQHAADATGEAAAIRDGVKLVMRQFTQALAKCDVAPVEALGKPFDPNLHEAIQQLPTADYEPGCVAAVLQTGYTIKERLLRPAMVVVATAPPEETIAGGNGKDHSGDLEAASAEPEASEGSDAPASESEAGDDEEAKE
jgi:molecular chaperone GrpE